MLTNLSSAYFVSETRRENGQRTQNVVPYHVFRASDDFSSWLQPGNDLGSSSSSADVIGAPRG